MELVYHYGNFGRKAATESTVDMVMIHNRRDFFHNLRASGESNWKALKKHPWLKPLAPVYQFGRYACRALTTEGAIKRILDGKERVEGKEKLLKELEIE